jgi:transcriptional regulator with XRE-family HTH domain
MQDAGIESDSRRAERPPPAQPWAAQRVAPRLIATRRALGLCGHDFAHMIGLDPSSLSKCEKGKKPLGHEYACRIFQLWGVDLNWLYLGRVDGLPNTLRRRIMGEMAIERAE